MVFKIIYGIVYFIVLYNIANYLSKDLIEVSTFAFILLSIINGLLFKLPSFVSHLKTEGVWKVEWIRLFLIMLPALFIFFSFNNLRPLDIIASFLFLDSIALTSRYFLTVISFILGYTLLDVVKKHKYEFSCSSKKNDDLHME